MVTFVATPIGNLGDITLRALDVLRAADVVFCEDTRHSLKLLNHFEIKKPLVSCHKFNEQAAAEKLVALAKEGKEVAVVTDAGTPVISDPGNRLVLALREAGIPYTLAPGACAFVAALVLSGLPADTFAFVGFLRGKKSEKRALLQRYAEFAGTLLFYSAPQDVDDDLALLLEAYGDRPACAVREITKVHESVQHFSLAEGLPGEKRGEYVLLVGGAAARENPLNSLTPAEHVAHYMAQGMPRKEALKRAAKERGVSKSELYKLTLDAGAAEEAGEDAAEEDEGAGGEA